MAVPVIQTVGRPLKTLAPITAWAVEVGEWVQNWLASNKKNASGNSSNSLRVVVSKPNEVDLVGADSLQWALAGRKAGKFPPPDNIKQWIQEKPVQLVDITLNSLAFLIGRKIAQSGTSEPKLRAQNLTLVINQLGKKHLNAVGNIQAKNASDAMVKLLTKNIPNTTQV